MRSSLIHRALSVSVALGLASLSPVAHASPFSLPTIESPSMGGGGGGGGGASEDDQVQEDSTVSEAKAEYRAGSDEYALGNYEEAVGHFERAYELSQEPALLFNLGQSYTRWYDISNDVDHLKKARRLYENYVLNVGATGLDEQGQADARADAQRRISEVDRRIAQHEEESGATGPTDGGGTKKPVHKKAWFWVAIVGGAAVIGGVVAAVVVTTGRSDGIEPELGTIGRAPSVGQGGGLTLRF